MIFLYLRLNLIFLPSNQRRRRRWNTAKDCKRKTLNTLYLRLTTFFLFLANVPKDLFSLTICNIMTAENIEPLGCTFNLTNVWCFCIDGIEKGVFDSKNFAAYRPISLCFGSKILFGYLTFRFCLSIHRGDVISGRRVRGARRHVFSKETKFLRNLVVI